MFVIYGKQLTVSRGPFSEVGCMVMPGPVQCLYDQRWFSSLNIKCWGFFFFKKPWFHIIHNTKSCHYAFVVRMLHCTVGLSSNLLVTWRDAPFYIFVKLEDSVVRQIQFACRFILLWPLPQGLSSIQTNNLPVAIEMLCLHDPSPTTSYRYW